MSDDLVQRLRAYEYSASLNRESADRIETLEAQFETVDRATADIIREHTKQLFRIGVLEAALREIQNYHQVSHCHECARRALESP